MADTSGFFRLIATRTRGERFFQHPPQLPAGPIISGHGLPSDFAAGSRMRVSSIVELLPQPHSVRIVPHGCTVRDRLFGMEPALSSRGDQRRILNPAAARFVVNGDSFRFLEPFLAQENTVSNAVRHTGADHSSVLYRVRQMLNLRLLEVTRVQRRAGRAIKHYRSTAPEFFVPFSATDAETIKALSAQFTAEFQAHFDAAYGATLERTGTTHDLGIRVWRNPDGHTSRDFMPAEKAHGDTTFSDWVLEDTVPPVWNQHALLRLGASDAKALQAELARVWERFSKLEDSSGKLHALRLAVVPLE